MLAQPSIRLNGPSTARWPGVGFCLLAGIGVGAMCGLLPWKLTLLASAVSVGAVVALGYPFAGACGLLAALTIVDDDRDITPGVWWPPHDFKLFHGLPSALWLVFLVLFASSLFRCTIIDRRAARVSFGYLWTFLAILAIAWAVGSVNGWPVSAMHTESLRLLYPALFVYHIAAVFDTRARIARGLWVMFGAAAVHAALLSGFFLAGRGVAFALTGSTRVSRIVTLDSAALLIFAAMLLLAMAHIMCGLANARRHALLAFGCAPLLFALIFSYRRAEWLGTLLGMSALLWTGTPRERARLLRFLALVVPVAILAFGAVAMLRGHGEMLRNLTARAHTLNDRSHSSNRYHAYETIQTLKDISQRPLTGLGLGSQHSPLPQFPDIPIPLNVVHNAWIMIWMKLGMAGLLAALWGVCSGVCAMLRGLRAPLAPPARALLLALIAATPVWLAQSVSGPMLWYSRLLMLVVLFLGLGRSLLAAETRGAAPAGGQA